MITLEECEARIWNDARLLQEAINDGELAYWIVASIKDDKDPMARNERVWNLIEEAVTDRAGSMADELNREQAEYEADAAHESRLIDRDNAAHINRMNGSY